MSKRLVRAADLYCGAGGSSSGLYQAADVLGFDVDLLAVNHWKVAIATHSANHPRARHLTTAINAIEPREAVPGGKLDLLWASPECTHFSQSRGGKPVSIQSRASGWHVLHWIETLRVDNLIIENVKEYRTWGPSKRVTRNGKHVWMPDPARKGETYKAFLACIRSMGYSLEERLLMAADYGDATTRERLFIIARRGSGAISWPRPTHAPAGRLDFGELKRWRAAEEVIDWSLSGRSIFNSKMKPLVPATMKRIEAGLRKFSGKPFILPHRMFDGQQVDAVDIPMRTFTAKGAASFGLVEPFLAKYYSSGVGVIPTSEPMPTITTKDRFALIQTMKRGNVVDVTYRLLEPKELAGAMGFASDYQFAGSKTDAKKQIGNAVAVNTARALCEAVLS